MPRPPIGPVAMTDAERARRYRARRKRGRSLEQRLDEAVYALDNLWSALLDAGTVADADTQDFRDAVTRARSILCDVSYAARRRLDPRDRLAGASGRSFPP